MNYFAEMNGLERYEYASEYESMKELWIWMEKYFGTFDWMNILTN